MFQPGQSLNRGSGRRLFALTVLCAVIMSLSPVATRISSAAQYVITNLGTVGTYGSVAYDINDDGQVAGRVADASNTTVNGYFWSRQGGLHVLTPLSGVTKAWGVSNSGRIAGQSNSHAVLWSGSNSSPQDLGTLGGATSFAYRINNNNQVIGWADKTAYSGTTVYHAFISEWNSTTQQYVMTDLGTLASDQGQTNYWGGYSLAYYANGAGLVVGTASTTDWGFHAFVWSRANGMTDLGTNPNFPAYEGYAVAINETGNLIVGCSIDSSDPNNSKSYPMVWKNGSTNAEIIPTLTAYPYAELYDVNGRGQVVGLMFDAAGNEHALIYETGKGIRDLNNLIPAGSGWELIFARSINESGQVVGYGKLNGQDRAFLLTPAAQAANDFDRDGKSDIAVFRPSDGNWYILNSLSGAATIKRWGGGDDVPVSADYDGDGKPDVAVWRPTDGNWYIVNSSDNAIRIATWGSDSDIPEPGDYDGDGKADIAVFRPSNGTWYIINSSTGTNTIKNWGVANDIPVPGDYDGDGKTDIAVFRPSNGTWYIINSSTGVNTIKNWGTNTDIPVPGDYDGDGKADTAVFRPSNGTWYIMNSSTGTYTVKNWGTASDVPVPGDYDGDGKADIAVFRPSDGNWYTINSSTGIQRIVNWGTSIDLPVGRRTASGR
ncbi:MAG TPA: FG-GAP-like repeat-containing protein [Dissulfurispiraceae bacterium]|nr:FG-GAP-like repeat-containing protein [Dissulfurispiraceae bacterium]